MINLDKARAARAAKREANGKAPVVVLGGQRFTLPVELPFSVANLMVKVGTLSQKNDTAGLEGIIEKIIRSMVGDQYDEFMKHLPSLDDITELFEGMLKEYGLSPGESTASAPSKTNSRRPRQTSKPATASISDS
jgi:hypothetical protein